MTRPPGGFDLAVVGAGIIGLSVALAAARRGLSVVVIDRDDRARGASVRNFGLITITGQDRVVWRRAQRSREIWLEAAAEADIPILRRGLWLVARRLESADVLEAFMRTDMAEGCRLFTAAAARAEAPGLQTTSLKAALFSPHELRMESREAIPKLAAWLERRHGVTFRWQTAVHGLELPRIETSRGAVLAAAAVVCPGDDLVSLFPERLADAGVGRCSLQMLRLESPGFELPWTVMSDLSLVRYGGFAGIPEAAALRERLEVEQPEHLQNGVHLILTQGADGSLVLGDSHHAEAAAEILDERVYDLLLDEYRAVTGRAPPAIRERWRGSYAMASDRGLLIESPAPDVRLVVITSGVGASTGFAIGEEVIDDLFG